MGFYHDARLGGQSIGFVQMSLLVGVVAARPYDVVGGDKLPDGDGDGSAPLVADAVHNSQVSEQRRVRHLLAVGVAASFLGDAWLWC